ncbi:hypothetical protein C8D94_102499 [Marinirhabdus gelatinilytica]|uniref:Uncharacterized protein n=1 Tax=Marinirhabdus gelatinilytica TaxID=1703343 RepID=A0A370QG26_9FLAO|nr:hypothetical protein C8D94_102499 [Marinirhabdus gelatinilytica]
MTKCTIITQLTIMPNRFFSVKNTFTFVEIIKHYEKNTFYMCNRPFGCLPKRI